MTATIINIYHYNHSITYDALQVMRTLLRQGNPGAKNIKNNLNKSISRKCRHPAASSAAGLDYVAA
jgi:hypothetical protein